MGLSDTLFFFLSFFPRPNLITDQADGKHPISHFDRKNPPPRGNFLFTVLSMYIMHYLALEIEVRCLSICNLRSSTWALLYKSTETWLPIEFPAPDNAEGHLHSFTRKGQRSCCFYDNKYRYIEFAVNQNFGFSFRRVKVVLVSNGIDCR